MIILILFLSPNKIPIIVVVRPLIIIVYHSFMQTNKQSRKSPGNASTRLFGATRCHMS